MSFFEEWHKPDNWQPPSIELQKRIDSALHHAVTEYLEIKKASFYAEILATEYYVCAGLGFVKYLN